jgi:hypothetical protein
MVGLNFDGCGDPTSREAYLINIGRAGEMLQTKIVYFGYRMTFLVMFMVLIHALQMLNATPIQVNDHNLARYIMVKYSQH